VPHTVTPRSAQAARSIAEFAHPACHHQAHVRQPLQQRPGQWCAFPHRNDYLDTGEGLDHVVGVVDVHANRAHVEVEG
jgi:hypothetical protein